MINVGDKYILHSENGNDYNIEVVNINQCRPPEERYACEVEMISDGKSVHFDDIMFYGEEFFKQCEKVTKLKIKNPIKLTTVSNLIDILEDLPGDAKVYVCGTNGFLHKLTNGNIIFDDSDELYE